MSNGSTAVQFVAAAKSRIENLAPEEVAVGRERGDVLLVDVRAAEERATTGTIAGSMHALRGMLEFFADPTSAYCREEFDPSRRTILFCAAAGGRSALGADTLQRLGYRNVAHLDKGIKSWIEDGMPIAVAT